MCSVCVEYLKGTITKQEADAALAELVFFDPKFKQEHIEEVRALIDIEDEE